MKDKIMHESIHGLCEQIPERDRATVHQVPEYSPPRKVIDPEFLICHNEDLLSVFVRIDGTWQELTFVSITGVRFALGEFVRVDKSGPAGVSLCRLFDPKPGFELSTLHPQLSTSTRGETQ